MPDVLLAAGDDRLARRQRKFYGCAPRSAEMAWSTSATGEIGARQSETERDTVRFRIGYTSLAHSAPEGFRFDATGEP